MQVGGTDRLISPPEVSKTLGLSPRSVDKRAELGYLTKVKVLRATCYRESEVQAIVRNGTGHRAKAVA